MKIKNKVGYVILVAGVLLAASVWAGQTVLDNFSTSRVGNFPKLWRTWPTHRDDAAKVYKVAEEGGERFIKAYDDHNASEQVFFNFDWQMSKRPKLSWKWRATTLPTGANETSDATNDSACGVYVVIGKYQGHAIKYVWSSTVPVGKVISRRDGKLKIKVLDSGAAKKGQWVKHTVDVPADYKTFFGKDLDKDPSGIALLTDGNAVQKPSGCDYADFVVTGDGE